MNVCNTLTERYFQIFSEISAIPHGSGNTSAIRDYCVDFAEKNNLDYSCDSVGNIIIRKAASFDHSDRKAVIIQGHLDMVCEKEPDCPIDMAKEGLKLYIDGDMLKAEGTTLGADDGIAVAYALAVLEDKTLSHPPLEVLLTSDEETGMIGANGLDFSMLKGKTLINIDSEEEGILTVGCAGGIRCDCSLKLNYNAVPENCTFMKISVSGLKGGHSGVEIHKKRANGIILMTKALQFLRDKTNIKTAYINGGSKDNVIPKNAEAVICTENPELVSELISQFSEMINSNLKDEKAVFSAVTTDETFDILSDKSADSIIEFIINVPDGVVEMMPDMDELVKSSLNLGTAYISDGVFKTTHLLRSITLSGRKDLEKNLADFVESRGGKIAFSSDYPAWEYRDVSPLREIMTQIFTEMYGKEPIVQTIHAGLECAVFDQGIENADMVSFGPDILNAHTPDEYLSISSARRCYEYLLEVLKKL